jgi:hypothetical protein
MFDSALILVSLKFEHATRGVKKIISSAGVTEK